MEQEEKYRQAKKRIAEIKGFYAHLLAYVAVNILLFVRQSENRWKRCFRITRNLKTLLLKIG